MIYYCENCKFLFERVSEIEQCPDCEKPTIAQADEKQQQEYLACKVEKHKKINRASVTIQRLPFYP